MPERIEIIVTADAADASGQLDELADQVEELTGVRPEITVDASGAVAEIESVGAAATDTAAATEELGSTGVDSIGSIKGSTRDLLRPLGLAKSQVGDLNDTFQLMADKAVESMNLTEDQAGQLAGALPVIGVAIGLGISAWGAYNDAQQKAAEAADKTADTFREVGDALSAGDIEAAAEKLITGNEELFESAADLGVPYQELADFISGAADEMPSLAGQGSEAAAELAVGAMIAQEAFGTAADGAGALGDKSGAAEEAMYGAAEAMGGAAAAAADLAGFLRDVNEQLDEQSSLLDVSESIDQLETALTDAGVAAYFFGAGSEESQDANRNLQGQLIDAKQDVIDYAEQVGDIPPEEITRILALIDNGKLAEAESAINYAARDRDATINVRPRVLPGDFSSWGGGVGGGAQGFAAAPTAGTRGATASAMAVAPQVTIRIDARGAVDPYSVGQAVERAAGAWGRVSGRWRPGLRSVS